MKKMISFLIIGGVAVFCQLHNHGGLLVDAGILAGLVGIIMAMERGKLLVECWEERMKAAGEKKGEATELHRVKFIVLISVQLCGFSVNLCVTFFIPSDFPKTPSNKP